MMCLVIDKYTRELQVGTLTLNFTYFSYFSVNSQLIFVYNKCLVLIQTCSRTIVDLQ